MTEISTSVTSLEIARCKVTENIQRALERQKYSRPVIDALGMTEGAFGSID